MSQYRVVTREVHVQGYIVEAYSRRHAISLVQDGQGELDEAHFEYSHMLEPDTWTVEINTDLGEESE